MMEHRARKRFGQNFLIDDGVVARIVAAIDPQADDHVVEIGPGLGVLTEALLARIPQLDAVELDRDLIPKLAQRCAGLGRLRIHAADALRFDFASLATDQRPLRVVGNLPYNISTPLMFHLLQNKAVIRDMHFMLQKEVVERLAAAPGGKEYGRLSVMMQFHCAVQALFVVPPQAFSPAPKVESAVVRLVPHTTAPVAVDDVSVLETVVTQAFAQRRKTLRNTLKHLIDAHTLERLGIDPTRRAETLTLDEFATIANQVARQPEAAGA
jgi:16S rRNA (adenine1518-N6/adenine1519-N6)-dimethyltransferase